MARTRAANPRISFLTGVTAKNILLAAERPILGPSRRAKRGADVTSQISGSARVRRTVSVVFADVTASTALAERLDPESFHDVLDQYCATCTSAVERHGGRVDKFIGDAVVGVFGLPTVH